MPTNTAAWLGARGASPALRLAPYTHPRANEIVVRNHAVATTPGDKLIRVANNNRL